MSQLLRSVLWRNIRQPGMEYCTLTHTLPGFLIKGIILQEMNQIPCHIEYGIVCDRAWKTQGFQVDVTLGSDQWSLLVSINDQKQWWRADQEQLRLRGCLDVMMGFTPATYTISIQRLCLKVGESRAITSGWLHLPELALEPLDQRYTRLAEKRFRYESATRGIVAELEVDDLGMIICSEGFWNQMATG
jgi:uncharacterized protein